MVSAIAYVLTFLITVAIGVYCVMWLWVPFTLIDIKTATEQQSRDIKELKEQLTRIENALKKEK